MTGSFLLFDFSSSSTTQNWQVIDDIVMGGRSNGKFSINTIGSGVFEGFISLDNYGGFSMVKHSFALKKVDKYSKFRIRLKGDGKRYQFRVKSKQYEKHSYAVYFTTSTDWQIVEIPYSEMYPAYRGRRLDLPNYPGATMEEIAFLIGNKKAEEFKLEIDWIELM